MTTYENQPLDTLLGFLAAIETYQLDCRIRAENGLVILQFIDIDEQGNRHSREHAFDLKIVSQAQQVNRELMRPLLPVMREVWDAAGKPGAGQVTFWAKGTPPAR